MSTLLPVQHEFTEDCQSTFEHTHILWALIFEKSSVFFCYKTFTGHNLVNASDFKSHIEICHATPSHSIHDMKKIHQSQTTPEDLMCDEGGGADQMQRRRTD